MDLLKTIKEKIQSFPPDFASIGLEAIILHIETAEKYLNRAKLEHDDNLFTDVIYRTNHAFEGILQEAYITLAGKDSSKTTPFEIEKYFAKNKIFKDRVLKLFTNYRMEWRNTSTHDYKLFFSEEEAFMAIVNVCAFINILLDQIIEKVNFLMEKRKTEEKVDEIKSMIKNYDSLSFASKVSKLIGGFYINELSKASNNLKEIEIIGTIAGFLQTVDPRINIETHEVISEEHRMRADMVLTFGDDTIIIELKRFREHKYSHQAMSQLHSYLMASGITEGILFLYEPGYTDVSITRQPDLGLTGKVFSVTTISPKGNKIT